MRFLVILAILLAMATTVAFAGHDGTTGGSSSEEQSVGQVNGPPTEATAPQSVAPPVGPRGPRGFRGRPGRDGKTIIKDGHQGHKGPYQHIKSWNPASLSFVKARDAKTLGEARAYTDGVVRGAQLRGHLTTTARGHRDHGWSIWPLLAGLLWILLILAILAGLAYAGWWLWRYFLRPVPAQPEEPDTVNTGSGQAFGEDLPESVVEVKYDGVAVAVKKGYLEGAPGPNNPFRLLEEGQKVRITSQKGKLHRFILLAQNRDVFPMPTETVWMRDELACQAPHEVEYAGFFLGNQELKRLNDAEKKTLTSGTPFPLKRYLDRIPVGEVAAFIYDVRCTSDNAAPEGIPSSDLGQSPLPPESGSEFKLDEIVAARKAKAEEEAKRKAEEDERRRQETEAQAEKPAKKASEEKREEAAETIAQTVDRLRKEILRGDYRIPDDFRAHLEGLGTEAKIREAMETYYHTRGRLIGIDKATDRRPDYRRISDLAAKAAMGQMRAEEAEGVYRPVAETSTDTGGVDDAKTGLVSGLTGGAS